MRKLCTRYFCCPELLQAKSGENQTYFSPLTTTPNILLSFKNMLFFLQGSKTLL